MCKKKLNKIIEEMNFWLRVFFSLYENLNEFFQFFIFMFKNKIKIMTPQSLNYFSKKNNNKITN